MKIKKAALLRQPLFNFSHYDKKNLAGVVVAQMLLGGVNKTIGSGINVKIVAFFFNGITRPLVIATVLCGLGNGYWTEECIGP